MPVNDYGVWVAKPTDFTAEDAKIDPKSPHIYLHFEDASHGGKSLRAAINVKSIGKESRLVFWLERNFLHQFTQQLEQLDPGFHPLNGDKYIDTSFGSIQGLDYIRTQGLVHIESGRVLPHDVPGPDNDILDQLVPLLKNVLEENATLYLFGASFGTGIHDIHMNQGSLPQFDNGAWKDGALFFRFEDHWEAVFLAFASQRVPTNDETGLPGKGSQSLADILGQ
ncbi:hypothetical protein N7492_009033 [Penicillium capsulatum]|uniref:DUF2278 domain-containing protein n=1 Tax=Penicillium capsulatum TaxID=69766 RepID=A0A9W9HTV8_9EURO|nr:hypothetical protein N7492_009033 [Penicillium capsulatum]KAJ6106432.1 hypothetical protein N7512_009949 [Penicillium capsulatum]